MISSIKEDHRTFVNLSEINDIKKKRKRLNRVLGSLYCSAHQNQSPKRLNRRPYYKHPVFILGSFLLTGGLALYFGFTGATEEGQEEIVKSVDETKSLVRSMRKYESDFALLQKYPVGYSLFSIDHKRNIIPNYNRVYNFMLIDWSSASIKNITPEEIFILTPTIKFPKNNRVEQNTVGILRKPGTIKRFATIYNVDFYLEVLDVYPDGFICLIGVKEKSIATR